MQFEQKDPSIDRNEFEDRLKSTLKSTNQVFFETVVLALLNNDTAVLDDCRNKIIAAQQSIDGYMAQWDAAKNQEERKVIVGSVTRS